MKKLLLYAVWIAFNIISIQYANAQHNYQKPKLEKKGSWSMILVPDPQNYVKWSRNQPIFDLMTAWIEDNIDTLNIKMVMCTGDLVEQNDIINRGADGDQSAKRQWQAIANSFSRLDGKVPYVTATGNHDYTIDASGNRKSHINEFFDIDKNPLNRKIIAQNSTSENGELTVENSAFELKSLNGKDYLFMTVEFAPRDTVLTWAKKVADMEQYKNHRLVLLTHAYLNDKDKRTSGVPKWFEYLPYSVDNVIQKAPTIELPKANSGEQIWEKLVKPSSNIDLVLCGHVSGEGFRTDKNAKGKPVHQMLFDAQSMGGGHRNGNGGDGWLRILEFFPDSNTVKVKTFSPLFGASPTTQEFAWKTDVRNEFEFKF